MERKHLKIYSGFRLFVAGATVDNLVGKLEGTPLGMRMAATDEEPIFELVAKDGTVFKTMLPPVKPSSLSAKKAVRTVSGVCVEGMIISLPAFYARLHAAQTAVEAGMPYKLDKLSGSLAVDTAEEIGKIVLGWGKSCKLPGAQAQAGTAPGVQQGTVVCGPKTAARMWDDLHKMCPALDQRMQEILNGRRLQDLPEEVQAKCKADAMYGSTWYTHREPVAGKFNCRKITLRVSADVVESQFVTNAGDWEFLNAGDEDGDILYLFDDGSMEYDWSIKNTRIWPAVEIIDSSEFITQLVTQFKAKPQLPEEIKLKSVEQVINACIKDLTGLLDYTYHNMAYAHGLCSEGSRSDWGLFIGTVFEPYLPVQEEVMDAKKSEGSNEPLIAFARTLKGATAGEVFSSGAFNPYIKDARLRGMMEDAVKTIGGTLDWNSNTLFGRVLRAGRNGSKQSVDIIKDLLKTDIEKKGEMVPAQVEDLLYLMHKDAARGINYLLPMEEEEDGGSFDPEPPTEKQLSYLKYLGYKGETPKTKKEASALIEHLKKPKVHIVKDACKGFIGVVTQLHYGNRELDRELVARRPNGQPWIEWNADKGQLRFRLLPLWKATQTRKDGAQRVVDVTVNVPINDEYKLADMPHGHVVIKMGTNRVFRPVYTTDEDGNVVKLKFTDELRNAIFRALETLQARPHGGSFDTMSEDINAEVQKWLIKLPEIDVYTKSFASLEEFEVRPRKNDLPDKWEELKKILLHCSDWADLNMTSKGMPGSCFGLAGGHGISSWYNKVNPFALYTERKRLPQHRVCAESVQLAMSMSRSVGFNPLFDEVELTVMIADTTANRIKADGWDEEVKHDTGQVFPTGHKKLAVSQYVCPASTLEQAQMMVDRFVRNGLKARITESTKAYDNELTEASFEVVIDGPFLDAGKVMGSLGPYKFVQCVDYNQIYAIMDGAPVPIDVVLPRYTTVKKNALDAVLYMLCVRAGITDPTTLPEDLDEKIAYLMERIPNGGMVPVVNAKGTVIGNAFVSKLPFYRTHHFAVGIESSKTGDRGVTVHWNEWAVNGVKPFVSKKTVKELRKLWDVLQYFEEDALAAGMVTQKQDKIEVPDVQQTLPFED